MVVDIKYFNSIQHPSVFKDDDTEVYIEDSSIGWIMHCYVLNWSVSCYKKLLDLLVLILNEAPNKELYCVSNNNKLTKFAEMLGFEDIDSLYDSEGKEIGVLMKCVNP